MIQDRKESTARILNKYNAPVGAGILVSDLHVLTCAHVVNDALGLRTDDADWPQAKVTLDFPLAANDEIISTTVVEWSIDNDVAVLELSPPGGLRPAILVDWQIDQKVKTVGFPEGYNGGLWVEGNITGPIDKGCLQIERSKQSESSFVREGFSGAPVWVKDELGIDSDIIGIIVESDEKQIANCIPTNTLIRLWPKLQRECPYRNLEKFRPEDCHLYFGREDNVARLFDHVVEHPFTAVLGASGSGKSSLVYAGLIAHVRNRYPHWRIADFRVSDDPDNPKDPNPFKALARGLVEGYCSDLEPWEYPEHIDKWTISLEKGTTLSTVLRTLAPETMLFRQALTGQSLPRLLLVADQFEELYTHCTDRAIQRAFLSQLLSAVNVPDTPLRLVITLRADFLDQALNDRSLAKLINQHNLMLEPLDDVQLRAVIEKPAKTQGIAIPTDVVELMVADIDGEPGYLPLLEFALTKLWEESKGVPTYADYQRIGTVKGALTDHANAVYTSLTESEQQQVQRIFRQLVQISDDGKVARRRVSDYQLTRDWPMVQYLVNERLLVINKTNTNGTDNQTTTEVHQTDGATTVEVAHETVLGHWLDQQEWFKENRKFLVWQRQLERDYQFWLKKGCQPTDLLQGNRLVVAQSFLKKYEEEIDPDYKDFVDGSIKKIEERERRELAARRRRKWMIVGSVLGIFTLIIAAIFLVNLLIIRFDEADSRALAINSDNALEKDIQLSTALGLLAISEAHTKEADAVVRRALQASKLQFVLSGHKSQVTNVTFRPDGKQLVTASEDGLVKIWEMSSGQELESLSVGKRVYGIAYDSTGALLAASLRDGSVIVWDVASGNRASDFAAHSGSVLDISFSPDGSLLATASEDKTIKLWDAKSGQIILTLTRGISPTRSLDFSPDGNHLAVAWDDGTAEVWNMDSKDKLLKLTGHNAAINDIEFSPTGEYLATVSDDEKIIVWETSSGQKAKTLSDTRPVYSVSFNPTGRFFVTSNRDGEVKLWSMDSDQFLIDYSKSPDLNHSSGTDNWIYRVEFSPDGTRIAGGSKDQTAKVWAVYGAEPFMVFGGHRDRVRDVNFSPDGQRLVSASWDNTAKVWDMDTGELLLTLRGHDDVLVHAIFNSDGTRIATASADGTAKIWDSTIGENLKTFSKHPTGIHDIVFSPDEQFVITTGLDGTIKIWDARTGEPLATFAAHQEFVSRVVFSPAGELLATAGHDNLAKVWDIADSWEMDTWEEPRKLEGHSAGVDAITFSPDGQFIATASWDNTAKVWDSESGDELFELSSHTASVNDVIYSPGGQFLVTASDDGTVKMWNANTGAEWITLSGHLNWVNEVAFSPDGKHLASAGGDGVVIVHTLDIEEMILLAKDHARPLKPDECANYLQQTAPCSVNTNNRR